MRHLGEPLGGAGPKACHVFFAISDVLLLFMPKTGNPEQVR